MTGGRSDGAKADRYDLVVVGAGMAAAALLEEIRKIRRDFSIAVFGDESHPAYNRVLLSDVLAGRATEESVGLKPSSWYSENEIALVTDCPVAAIEADRKAILTVDGSGVDYGRVVLAVGARPFVPPMAGADRHAFFVFRTLEDCRRIAETARRARSAVVVGGGLLGLEAARAIGRYGPAVTVVHLADRLMEQQLDPAGGGLLRQEIERLGISVRLGTTVAELCGGDRLESVRLATGETLSADLVVVCAGVRPDLRLARSAGLSTARGIVVDDQMRTSDPAIFALGDVAEHAGKVYGLVAPIRDQARAAADAIAGDNRARYHGTMFSTTLKVAGVRLTSAGDLLGGGGREELADLDSRLGRYRKLVFRGNRLVGMILLGDDSDGPRLFNLIRSGADASSLRQRAVAGEDGADDLPAVWRMADDEIVCQCHSVTKGGIRSAIETKGCKSREAVASVTAASTGCGSCAALVEDLLVKPAKIPVKAAPKVPARIGEAEWAARKLVSVVVDGVPILYPKKIEAERIKKEGLGLNWDHIRREGVGALSTDDFYRLKSYGVCSQKHPGNFMVRIRIPGGCVTALQAEGLADLAESHGRGRAHLTTRQDLELHWVRVEDMPEIWRKLEAIGLSTRSACGHTLRNVTACPHAGIHPGSLLDVQPWAEAVTNHFVFRSDLINPRMPNRLNIFFSGCPDCDSEAQINDIGFIPRRNEAGELGWEVWAGGSLGATPRLGFRIKEFLPLEAVIPVCQTVFELHMNYGSREKGKSRLKFLIERWGQARFTAAFEQGLSDRLTMPADWRRDTPLSKPLPPSGPSSERMMARVAQWLPDGIRPQRQVGYAESEIAVPMGEIRAEALRGLAKISRRYADGRLVFTPNQTIALHYIPVWKAGRLSRAVKSAGLAIRIPSETPRVLACPGTEFCVLAVTNAQGAAREVLTRLRPKTPEAARLLSEISIHLSGCPNSCAKHQVAEIGLAGSLTTVGADRRFAYFLFLGGTMKNGARLGEVVRKGITDEKIRPTVEAVLEIIAAARRSGEAFTDIVARLGLAEVARLLEARLGPPPSESEARVELEPELVTIESEVRQ